MLTVAGCGEFSWTTEKLRQSFMDDVTYSCCYKAMVSLVSPAANMTDSVSQTWQEKHSDTVWFVWSNWPQSRVSLVEVVKPIKEHQISPFGLTLSASTLSFRALWSRRTCGQKIHKF